MGSEARRVVLRSVGIVAFVLGTVVALLCFAGDSFRPSDPVWLAAIATAIIGAVLGIRFRKRGADVTVANVAWRVAPLAGIAVGIFYVAIFFSTPPPDGEPSFFGIILLAFAGVGVVWGSLCAAGAVAGGRSAVGLHSAAARGWPPPSSAP